MKNVSLPRELTVDFAILGSGPAGQRAALDARAAGATVALIEEGRGLGGACVHYGTIPSKTLRETAYHLSTFRQRSGAVADVNLGEASQVASLMSRLHEVVDGHVALVNEQMKVAGVETVHGRGSFVDAHHVHVIAPNGATALVTARHVIIATGSVPRTPPEIAVDHESILDSDSILSMIYLPRSLVIFGGGVIACEYASIFAALGVEVTMIDRGARPLVFLDAELTDCFVSELEARGGKYRGNTPVESSISDGVAGVITTLKSGEIVRSDKALCALGRVASLGRLNLPAIGVTPTARGLLEVDANGLTSGDGVYAVGDVIGPPALASAAMEQARRAIRHALGLPTGRGGLGDVVPAGIYTIPEISAIGMSEDEAKKALHGHVLVGRARFGEVARGLINGVSAGLLKLVADSRDGKIVGAHLVGEGATELVHIAQVAMAVGASIDMFCENVFNFPTLAELYRVAALDIATQRARLPVDLAVAV